MVIEFLVLLIPNSTDYFLTHSTVFSKLLEAHLKKCNANVEKANYFAENINKISHVEEHVEVDATENILRQTSKEEFFKLFAKIDEFYSYLLHKYEFVAIKVHDYKIPENVKNKARHLHQSKAIISVLDAKKVCASSFVELGCGKAGLSMEMASQITLPTQFYLVDKSNFKRKMDCAISLKPNVAINRIKIDIKDLDLSKLEISGKVVLMSKHLCGSATCLSLKLIANLAKCNKDVFVLITPCCHFKSTTNSFIFPEFLSNFTPLDFKRIIAMTSWYTCELPEGMHYSGISYDKCTEFGYKCKRIMDIGRAVYLQNMGFEVEFIKYCDEQVTRENILIFAHQTAQIAENKT